MVALYDGVFDSDIFLFNNIRSFYQRPRSPSSPHRLRACHAYPLLCCPDSLSNRLLFNQIDFYTFPTRTRISEPVEKVLRDSKMDKANEVVFVVGSTRIPKVFAFSDGKEPNSHPCVAVAAKSCAERDKAGEYIRSLFCCCSVIKL